MIALKDMMFSLSHGADTQAGALMAKRGIDWGRANRERRMLDRGVSNVTDEKER
jgi:hypothetical protein